MRINPDCTLRLIAGETIVVNQGGSHTDMTRIISLNTTARFMWENLEGKEFTSKDAAHLLVEHYGISEEQAAVDAAGWIERLKACEAILEN